MLANQRTDVHGQIDLAIDPDEEYIYILSNTVPEIATDKRMIIIYAAFIPLFTVVLK